MVDDRERPSTQQPKTGEYYYQNNVRHQHDVHNNAYAPTANVTYNTLFVQPNGMLLNKLCGVKEQQ